MTAATAIAKALGGSGQSRSGWYCRRFGTLGISAQFSERVIKLVPQHHPDALDDGRDRRCGAPVRRQPRSGRSAPAVNVSEALDEGAVC